MYCTALYYTVLYGTVLYCTACIGFILGLVSLLVEYWYHFQFRGPNKAIKVKLSLILNSLYKMCIVNISPSACSRGRDSAGHLRGGGDHGAAGVRQVGGNINIVTIIIMI